MRTLPLLLVSSWTILCPAPRVWSLDTAVLTFAGDLMAHPKTQSMTDYDEIYRSLAPWLTTDDWSFINLETPVNDHAPPSGYPRFNATPAFVEAAVRGGFDVFALANNHANDGGVPGIEGTLRTMRSVRAAAEVQWSGLRDTSSDEVAPLVFEKKGWRIGFLSLTNLVNLGRAHERVNLVAVWDIWSRKVHSRTLQWLLDRIPAWRQGLDCLVLGFHDGAEYTLSPDPIQEGLYRQFVEAGVDVFWGHHPHTLQPWTWIDTPRGRRLVMYSMGNFVSGHTLDLGPHDFRDPLANTGDGALLRVVLGRTPGGVQILGATPILLSTTWYSGRGTVVVPTETLVREAPPQWKEYYRYRWEVQKSWTLPGD